MSSETKVLVVGTTADYIDWIQHRCPGQALFLTAPRIRRQAEEPCPPPPAEILADLDDGRRCMQMLDQHLSRFDINLDGVACFDCESMPLAAVLADHYHLPYPSVAAVANCRNKYLAKQLWRSSGLQIPRARPVGTPGAAAAFFEEIGGDCVLKPMSGSGSEFVFRCDSARSCEHHFQLIRNGIERRRDDPLYGWLPPGAPWILAEEFIQGEEYSCDFLLAEGRAEMIRLTRKVVSSTAAFGTARGYLLLAELPPGIRADRLRDTLFRCATVLGLDRAICMLDFMVCRDRIVLLELAPRPGGDCLPFLLQRGGKLDMLQLFLDFCRQRPLKWPPVSQLTSLMAMRVHANKSGILKRIETQQLQRDPRVKEIHLTRRPGHLIKMPPEDYDSWLLGHVIFEPDKNTAVELQCRSLGDKLVMEIG